MEQIAAIHPLVLSLPSMPLILVSFGANNKVRGCLLSVRFSEKGFKFYDDTVRESAMSEKSVRKNRTIHTCFVSQSPKCSRGCPCDRARACHVFLRKPIMGRFGDGGGPMSL